MNKQNRVDIVLADGKRRRGFYDFQNPDVIKASNFEFRATDSAMNDARVISGDPEVCKVLEAHGFSAYAPNSNTSVFCVRMKTMYVDALNQMALETGRTIPSLIAEAVRYWLDNGAPIAPKK